MDFKPKNQFTLSMSNLLSKPSIEQDSFLEKSTDFLKKQVSVANSLPVRLVEESSDSIKSNRRVTIPSPVLLLKDKLITWSNFSKTCMLLKRSKKHMFGFFAFSLNVKLEISEEGMELPSTCTKVKIRQLLDKYIQLFVICKKCKSFETELVEKNEGLYVKCCYCACETERNPKSARL